MIYKALYRKYRPKKFSEVAGQQVVVQILKNSIISGKIYHSYLFYGPRGTGKTSIAKIFAKTINCECAENGDSCEKCSKCLENNNNESVDIVEIDAASNNGVDEIRELKSRVNLVPSTMKYKVYIIDEVHMLSIGAFNALLKTLEEPPEHVVFILATTELRKVPNTIVSRCQLLEFKKISENDMLNNLKNICLNEKINIDDGAIEEIIKYSDGGMRDALGLLDKLSLYSTDLITKEVVRTVCGNASEDDVKKIVNFIKKKDINLIVDEIDYLYSSGVDLINVVNDIIMFLKNEIKNSFSNVCSIILELTDVLEKMKYSINPKVVLEASIVKILSNFDSKNISREIFLDSNQKENETPNAQIDVGKLSNGLAEEFDQENFKRIRVNNVFVNADKDELKRVREKWNKLSEYVFDYSYGSVASSLIDADVVVCSDLYIVLVFKYDSLVEKINANFRKVEQFIDEFCGKKYKIVCLNEEEWNNKKNEYILRKRKSEEYIFIEDNADIKNKKVKENNNGDDLILNAELLFGKDNIVLK